MPSSAVADAVFAARLPRCGVAVSKSKSSRSRFSPAQVQAAELLARRAGITRSLKAVGSDREDFIELHVDQLVALLTQDLAASAVEVADCLRAYGMEDLHVSGDDLVFVTDKDLPSWAGKAARCCRAAILAHFGDCGSAWQVRSVLVSSCDAEVSGLLKRAPFSVPMDRRILVCFKVGGAA